MCVPLISFVPGSSPEDFDPWSDHSEDYRGPGPRGSRALHRIGLTLFVESLDPFFVFLLCETLSQISISNYELKLSLSLFYSWSNFFLINRASPKNLSGRPINFKPIKIQFFHISTNERALLLFFGFQDQALDQWAACVHTV